MDSGIVALNTPKRWRSKLIFQSESTFHATKRILFLYQLYRIALSLLLILVVSVSLDHWLLNVANQQLFFVTCWVYFLCNLISLFFSLSNNPKLALSLIFFDIIILSILFYAAAGPSSGIGNLLIVTVAIANSLFRGQIGLLIAAISSIAIVLLTGLLSLSTNISISTYIQAATLGALSFISAVLIQNLITRMRTSEALAKQKASDVANLQILNNIIVEQMPSGVLLVNKTGQIIMANNEALHLLGEPVLNGLSVANIFPELYTAIKQWLNNPKLELQPLQPAKKNLHKLRPTIVQSRHSNQLVILVFLESIEMIAKQVQQIKLASLGHLTASIAHEIRNPLGALSHAVQLLKESENMDTQDQRLLQIILNNSDRMNNIISNVLQLSRKKPSHTYNYEMKPLELTLWLENFILEYQETLRPDQLIELDIATRPIYTYIIPSQLHQIVTNLANNGFRHTKKENEATHIWLMLYIDSATQLPQLDILDNGPGVPIEYEDKLFEPFFTTSNDGTGTGLGLFVTKELCESNQAQLTYLPRKNGGSCFRVTFCSATSIL